MPFYISDLSAVLFLRLYSPNSLFGGILIDIYREAKHSQMFVIINLIHGHLCIIVIYPSGVGV